MRFELGAGDAYGVHGTTFAIELPAFSARSAASNGRPLTLPGPAWYVRGR